MAICLQVEQLGKAFGDRTLFENVAFSVSDGQKIALIAKNGMGKTTLLNILAGRESEDAGTITFRRDLRLGYLHQQPQFDPALNVIEACLQCDNEAVKTIARYEQCLEQGDENQIAELMAEMDLHKAWDYEARIKQILGKLRITDFKQKIGQLSGGQLKRVALANALIAEPDVLILDEPTNHLDLEMVEWLEEFLRTSAMALLMVTHDRYFLDRVCTDILEIDNCQMYAYKGNYSYYLDKRAARMENWNAESDKFANLYRKELEWMRRMPQARGHKSKSRVDEFYKIEERAKQRVNNDSVKLNIKSSYIGNKIFEIKDLCKSFDSLRILDNFSYTFARYEKMGIVGKNGTGKSTFLKILLGERQADSGTIDIGETVKFGYYSQDGLQFDEQMKVIDVVTAIAEEIDLGNGKKLSASQFLLHFLFSPEAQHNYVYKLSGGEKQRLHLCVTLIQNPNFLVLDEPTNDLDIVTLNILEEYLANFKGCLIVVSHDRYFMDKVVDHLLVFRGNAELKDFPGNYTQFREAETLRLEQEREEAAKVAKAKPAVLKPKADQPRKLTFKEKQELAVLDEQIPQLEAEKTALEAAMSSGQMSADEIMKASEQFQALSDDLDEKTMRWLELSDI